VALTVRPNLVVTDSLGVGLGLGLGFEGFGLRLFTGDATGIRDGESNYSPSPLSLTLFCSPNLFAPSSDGIEWDLDLAADEDALVVSV
jgi:hypothetical protein